MMQDLTKGKPFFSLFKFTLPIIGGNLFQLFYTLSDTLIVGQTLGADALSAVGSTTIIIYLVLCFIQGITSGFGICLGQRYGARDEAAMKRSIAVSFVLSLLFTILITTVFCLLSHHILYWMQTPEDIHDMAYEYMFIVLLGTGATVFYNLISNILRALGDSKTPLYFLVVSSLLNIVLDFVFILPLEMGAAGAAWATVLSQLLSAILCILVGWKKFSVMHVGILQLKGFVHEAVTHLKVGFPMGFQMSLMCIGQLAMQAAVNALGAEAIAGYTAATKVDQVSVLVNQAFGIAISNFVAQNYGAGKYKRIRDGVRASLIQTEIANIFMCALILLCHNMVVPIFINQPTDTITHYASGYLITVAPFYLILGMLSVYRSSIQSMGNSQAPFVACIIELSMRICGTMVLSKIFEYTGICLATPLAWIGATSLLITVYYRMIRNLLR